MFLSKPGKVAFAGALSLAAAPALAAEVAPLDDMLLSRVTALGVGNLAQFAWLPEPGDRILPAAGIGADGPAGTNGLIRAILQSGRSTMTIEGQDARGTISRIFQTATIDLSRITGSQTSVGVTMQSAGYEIAGGGQSATNLAVAATLDGLWGFGSIRP